MIKHGIDQEALIGKFFEAGAKQGKAIRNAVTETTSKALQGCEASLSNIRQVPNTVAEAASAGAAGRALPAADVETLLTCARHERVAGDARQRLDARQRRADRHVRCTPARRRCIGPEPVAR
jgi:hypothetical protein